MFKKYLIVGLLMLVTLVGFSAQAQEVVRMPMEGSVYYENHSPHFQWPVNAETADTLKFYRLVVRDSQNRVVLTQKVKPNRYCNLEMCRYDLTEQTPVIQLPFGQYRWHTVTVLKDGTKTPSESITFTLARMPRPVLLSPVDNGLVTVNDPEVQLSYNLDLKVKKIEVTVYRQGKSNPLLYYAFIPSEKCVNGLCTLALGDLENGRYRWQVRITDFTGKKRASHVSTFQVLVP